MRKVAWTNISMPAIRPIFHDHFIIHYSISEPVGIRYPILAIAFSIFGGIRESNNRVTSAENGNADAPS